MFTCRSSGGSRRMYKATKDFVSDTEQTVSIRSDELVVVVNKTNEYWWLISNDQHQTGYVPASCIAQISQQDKDNQVLQSINEAIGRLSKDKATMTKQEQQLIRELESQRSKLQQSSSTPAPSSSSKRRAPPPPVRKQEPPPPEEKQTQKHDQAVKKAEVAAEETPPPPAQTKVVETHKVPETLGSEMVESLQKISQLSRIKSKEGVVEILRLISVRVETSQNLIQEILATLQGDDEDDEEILELEVQLANLCEIKDDCQQRNWKIQNDDDVIIGVIRKIDNLLATCKKNRCEMILKKDDHLALRTLVAYHQMETNSNINLMLLQIFGMICSFFPHLISFLLTSVLPLELISDISNHVASDSERVCFSAILLSVLLSQTEDHFTSHQLQDALSEKFCCHLLDTIEDDVSGDDVTITLIRLVLAINLKYPDPSSNRVMTSLMKSTRTRFSEEILLLLNRGDDPVRVDDVTTTMTSPQNADSVIKFLTDVFACKLEFLYTNDLTVLLDIVTRNLNDLPPSAKRTEMLDLYLNIWSNRNEVIESRGAEIRKILQRIQRQEKEEQNNQNEIDQQIIQMILQ